MAGWLGGWVGRLEKVEIKPSQPAGAGAGLSLAKKVASFFVVANKGSCTR